MPLRCPRGSIHGDGTIDAYSFDSLPGNGELPADPVSVRFRSIAEIMMRVSNAAWPQIANCRTNRGELLSRANLFWAISKTLYPSRLLSFRTKPSLCLRSPKRQVLATPKTSRTEVIREQRSKTQRHRSTVSQRCDSGQKEPVGSQGDRVPHARQQDVFR